MSLRVLIISNMFPSRGNPAKGVFVSNIASMLSDDLSLDLCVLGTSSRWKVLAYSKFYLDAFKRLQQGQYDLVYAHYASHVAVPIILVKWLRRFKLITHVHGSDVFPEESTPKLYALVKRLLSRRLLCLSQRVVVPSSLFKSSVEKEYSLEPRRVLVSPSGGVDLSIFYPRDDYEVGCGLRVGFCGRLEAEKGFGDFLSLTERPDLSNGFAFSVVGSGSMTSQAKVAEEASLIKYYGVLPQEKLPEFFESIDVLVFPSRRKAESLGLVALEAMACGVPVIAYEQAGVTTFLKQGLNGLMVPPGDIAGIASALTEFRSFPEAKYVSMRSAAISTAKLYDAALVKTNLLKIFYETEHDE